MKKFQENALKGLACSVSAMALVISAPVMAQDADPEGNDEDEEQVDTTDDGGTSQDADIVVTGSRIKRDTYSSVSPLQVLTTEASQEAGLFDPSQILQRSESASGQQIDATFQGFVLDNGPGSQTLNLRGLGAGRTLLLVNGRRLAPAGVEGAPSNPSINLLPGSLIERYDLLLDGASSVYGSDAVAGVGNIVLRKDFDGLELFARGEINPAGAGEDYTISASYGINLDRGFIGIGAEYDYRDAVTLGDRDFFSGCDTHYEVDQNGNILTSDIASDAILREQTGGAIGLIPDDCKRFVGTGAILVPGTRGFSFFFQGPNGPGVPGGNTPIPNFSDTQDAFGNVLDADGNGIRDVDFRDYNISGLNPGQTFLSEQKLINVMAYGEYTLAGDANITPYFEANYSRAEIFSNNTGVPNIAIFAPADNPFNPCNFTTNPNGVDCADADNVLNGLVPGSPFFGFALPTGNNLAARAFFTIEGDRNNVDVTQEQYRGVLGVKGDLPFLSPSWTFDASFVYSRSEGSSVRRGVREDRMALALGYDPTITDSTGDGIPDGFNGASSATPTLAGGPCDASSLALAQQPNLTAAQQAYLADLTTGCVPVNIFAESVINGRPFGNFASQAERDYVFGEKLFDTTYEQIVANAFITGNLFDLPAGPVGAVFGFEWRKDKIDSQPDFVTANGLLIQQNSDQGAQGDKWIREAFGEIDIPLEAGKPWVEELNVNLAGRVTDEEFYGTNFTYSLAAGWRPIAPLQFKFTYGTSFRAPNLRENFLAGQTGFLTLFDPCAVPDNAFNSLAGGYDASLDQRDPTILAACIREGRDPTQVGIDALGTNTDQTNGVEITTGGSLDINPETSRSMTAGFAFEETFGDGYDVSLGFNYYDIKIEGAIAEPSSQFIINDCYTRQDGSRSPFCDRIAIDPAGNDRLLITDVNSGFINLNQESVRGMDINATFGKEVNLFGRNVDLGLNIRANHLIERSSLFIDDNGNPSFDEDAGEFSLPKWTGRATFTADIDNVRFTWQTRYTGAVEQDPDGIDPLSDAFGNGPDGNPTGFIGDTCTGGGSANGAVAGDGVFCRDVGFADEQFLHTASIRYRMADRFTVIVGVDNIFDTAPPKVDGNEVFSIANTAIGAGYDYDGREFFASVNVEF